MPKVQKKERPIPKINEIKLDKISIVFRKSILKQILKILTMEHGGFRTFKSVKNINRLFANIDMSKYKSTPELETYIWCISYMSKRWLDGIVTPDISYEMMKCEPEFTNVAGEIIEASMNDENIITAPEAKAIFDLISENLQCGYIASLKDEYIQLLDDIDMSDPSASRKIVERLFMISKSLLDVKHNTNMVANKIEFSSADMDSIKEAISTTLTSLSSKNSILKIGIRRINTLFSPGLMNGRLYVIAGLPGSYKSGFLVKCALDIRKYNPGYQARTPGMKPCVLYITMENTFTETIERVWNMTFDEPMTNFSEEQAIEMITKELGITKISNETKQEITPNGELRELDLNGEPKEMSLATQLQLKEKEDEEPNIEIVIQYYPYRSINTDDLYTVISDLRDENMEVCALVFDYIKRIEPATPVKDNERLELDHICNELKALSVIEDIPVLTAHQLNRAGATAVDAALRAGRSDVIKEAGRDNIGGAHAILEIADFLATVGTEFKSGTNEKYFTMNVLKRRRIDAAEAEFEKYNYLAHPFSLKNPFRLCDDMNLDKVLSVQSLATDIDKIPLTGEKSNAVKRLQVMKREEFNEDY